MKTHFRKIGMATGRCSRPARNAYVGCVALYDRNVSRDHPVQPRERGTEKCTKPALEEVESSVSQRTQIIQINPVLTIDRRLPSENSVPV
jgi:hypothetical protein